MTAILYAIDPGAHGAFARFVGADLVSIHDPVGKSLAGPLANLLIEDAGDPANDVSVAIERVGGLPGQSGPGMFAFGQCYGELIGVCIGLGVLHTTHPPMLWKAALGLRRAKDGETAAQFKARSLAMARGLWPDKPWFARAKDEGRAEAALIGHYVLTQGLFS